METRVGERVVREDARLSLRSAARAGTAGWLGETAIAHLTLPKLVSRLEPRASYSHVISESSKLNST